MTVECFFGGIGKDNSWGLASNKRVILFKKSKSEFMAFDSLAEAHTQVSDLEDRVYYWVDGAWRQVHFLVEGDETESASGFSP